MLWWTNWMTFDITKSVQLCILHISIFVWKCNLENPSENHRFRIDGMKYSANHNITTKTKQKNNTTYCKFLMNITIVEQFVHTQLRGLFVFNVNLTIHWNWVLLNEKKLYILRNTNKSTQKQIEFLRIHLPISLIYQNQQLRSLKWCLARSILVHLHGMANNKYFTLIMNIDKNETKGLLILFGVAVDAAKKSCLKHEKKKKYVCKVQTYIPYMFE